LIIVCMGYTKQYKNSSKSNLKIKYKFNKTFDIRALRPY
jgi:hypothetical protein